MSLAKFKIFMRKSRQDKKEKELEEHRHMIKILVREKKRREQRDRSENIKKGASALAHGVGHILPKNKLEIKSNRPAIRR